MAWRIVRTDTFSITLKRFKKRKDLLGALDKKIERLKQDPHSVGGHLSGRLHGYESTRLVEKFRLVFRISDSEKRVFLLAIDHRKFGYGRF